MMFQLRSIVSIAAVVLLAATCSSWAEQPAQTKPTAERAVKPAIDPVLEKVLTDWQQAQSDINRLDTRFTYLCYDSVFEVALQGQGLLSIDRKGRGSYKLEPASGLGSRLVNGRFQSKPCARLRWQWTQETLVMFDDRARTYDIVERLPLDQPRLLASTSNPRPAAPPLPEDVLPEKPVRQLASSTMLPDPPPLPEDVPVVATRTSPTLVDVAYIIFLRYAFTLGMVSSGPPSEPDQLDRDRYLPKVFPERPFLLDTKPSQLRTDFKITLTKQTPTETWLVLRPLTPNDQAVYTKAVVILNCANYQVKAMKLFAPSGNSETVYVFSDVQINQPPNAPFIDLERLNLRGFKRLAHPNRVERQAE